ncbi:MAG: ATP-dependent Clp protease adaptor ClpS [Nitrospirota bacterium]|nr:ATP-dependent Clp protease adaptor ClpS [Nitrospirota bacterium]
MGTKVSLFEEASTFVIEPWNVILINDNRHTFDEVIVQLMKATGCSPDQAREITWQVHTQGEALCYTGPRERCEHVASILEEIELRVRLERA